MGLCSVLDEEGVTFGVVGNVIHDAEVVNSVNSASSVVGLMNGVSSDVRFVNDANQMEMNRVTTQLEGLANIEKLGVFDSCN